MVSTLALAATAEMRAAMAKERILMVGFLV
jgi:hypothetical protein